MESKRWSDVAYDKNNTVVDFRNCWVSSDPHSTGTSAHITLRKDVFGPDPNYGQKSTACSSNASWSNPGKGSFYFTLDRINGTAIGFTLNSDPVYIKW